MSKLNLIDNYIIERKNNKTNDLLTMVLTTAKLFGTRFNKPVDKSLGNKSGYNTLGLCNHEYGYYYITRCGSEKAFNSYIFNGRASGNAKGNQLMDFSFTGKYPPSHDINKESSFPKIIKKLKNIYIDLKSNVNEHYYYDIGFNDHTFIIVKYKNNFRLIQSWMLKYQLENIIFDDDIHYSFPRFITLLFAFQYYKCMKKSIDIINIICKVFVCFKLQAKQYLSEFKYLFMMIFSKELHINGQTFNLHLEKGSENSLCPDPEKEESIRIIKYKFDPDKVSGDYNITLQDVLTKRLSKYPKLENWYRTKMGVRYPFYDVINPQVNIDDNIAQIINYNIYPYLSRDHNFDTIILNYIIKNYNIKLDSKSILEKLLALADLKNKRDSELVKMQNTMIRNIDKTVLSIYANLGMEQFGGDGNIVHQKKFEDVQYSLDNLKLLNDKQGIKEVEDEQYSLQNLKLLYDKQGIKEVEDTNLKNLALLLSKKIEKNDEYIMIEILMANIEQNIINDKIFEPFNKTDLTKKLNEADVIFATRMYDTIKNSVIQLINSHIKITFEALLSKLNVSEQLVLITRLYLVNQTLRPILTEFINKSKREVYDFISEIIGHDIIENFYSFSYSRQVNLVEQFDIIECINKNKEIILKVLNKIEFKLPDEMYKITTFQNEIIDINKNNVSDKIITNYVLPIISSSTESNKLQTLIALKICTKSESGINYIDTVLDNEIMFFGKM